MSDIGDTAVPEGDVGGMREVARAGTIYAAANILGRSVGFVLLPLYTHVLSVADYGLYTVLVSVIDVASQLFGMGMAGAMGRLWFDHAEDGPERNAVVSTAILGFAALSLIVTGAAWAGADLWATMLLGRTDAAALFPATIGAVMLTVLFEIACSYFVVRKDPTRFLWLSATRFVALMAANILIVVVLRMGVAGVIYALVAGFALALVPALALILPRVGLRFDRRVWRALLGFGLPLVPGAFAHSSMRFVERYVLSLRAGVAAVAVYGLADRLVAMLQMFVAAPFAQIFVVRRFETLSRGESQRGLEAVLVTFVAVMAAAGLAMSVLGHEGIALIAPRAYAGALPVIPVLVLAYILAALNVNMELGLLYAKRTHVVPLIGFAALAIAVPVNLALAPLLGAVGAALASATVNAVRLVMVIVCNRRWGTPSVTTDWPRVVALLVLVTAIGLIAVAPQLNRGDLAGLAGRLLLWAAFAGLLATSPLLSTDTRAGLRALLRRARPAGAVP